MRVTGSKEDPGSDFSTWVNPRYDLAPEKREGNRVSCWIFFYYYKIFEYIKNTNAIRTKKLNNL
jgi:hypothetical protein